MKKFSLLFIIVGILFSSLGSKLYVDYINEKREQNLIFKSFYRKIEDICEENIILFKKTTILNKYLQLFKDLKVSLNREEYNILLLEVNTILYEDVRLSLLEELKQINKLIEEKEYKYSVKERMVGNISAYTAYCTDGCHGYTASGRYIGNNIYYQDKDYGTVRIVAGDKSLPFGTIVRFNNIGYYGKEVYAIVLDRGGAVGNGRKVLFDLLFKSEKEANDFGIQRNVECDILRKGY